MSLVDYASSSEDEGDEQLRNINEEEEEEKQQQQEDQKDDNPHGTINHTSISSSNRLLDNVSTSTVERLPDASMLLNSPAFSSHQMSGSDHYSRVSAAMAESASRKRESNGTVSSHQRNNKFPRSNLPHSRNIPETVGGLLVPPQLSGRSNVVTEDLGRLFARRNGNPSTHRSSEHLS